MGNIMSLLGGLFGGGQAPEVKQPTAPAAAVQTVPQINPAQAETQRAGNANLLQTSAPTIAIQPLQTSQPANYDLVKFLTDTGLKLNEFRTNMFEANLSQLTSNVLDAINATLKALGGTLIGKLVTPTEKLATQQTPTQAAPTASPQASEADLNELLKLLGGGEQASNQSVTPMPQTMAINTGAIGQATPPQQAPSTTVTAPAQTTQATAGAEMSPQDMEAGLKALMEMLGGAGQAQPATATPNSTPALANK